VSVLQLSVKGMKLFGLIRWSLSLSLGNVRKCSSPTLTMIVLSLSLSLSIYIYIYSHVSRVPWRYSHVSRVPWRIITGSWLDDWIYWHSYYNYISLQSLITAHNQWLPKARSISFLDYEHLLFHCGWLINSRSWLIPSATDSFFSNMNLISWETALLL
jgi:hypothetical protein